MKKLRLIAVTVVLLTGIWGCGGAQAFRATREVSLTQPWSGFSRIEVAVSNGGIEVRPGSAPDVRITGTKSAAGATPGEAEENVEDVSIVTGAHPDKLGTLLVELRYPEELKYRSPGAKLLIEVPEPCPTAVHTSNGNIRVANMNGEALLVSSNGTVVATDHDGPVEAKTSNGNIEITSASGPVKAVSSNGRVTARGVQGDCDAESSNGDIEIAEVSGSVRAETSNGSVHVDAAPTANGFVTATSSNGSVRITLPRDVAASFRLDTSNGRATLNLDEAKIQYRSRSKTHVTADYNGGGARIEADTTNGSVTVNGR